MKPHQKLDVWKLSFDLVKLVYSATKSFPDDEKFGLTSQLRRAAVSVPVNIAEGAARKSKREFAQFLYIANGSISELDTLFLLSFELKYIDMASFENLNSRLVIISKCNIGLIRSLGV